MDGRIQEPTIEYLKRTYNAEYVDTITEPGPCKLLSDNDDPQTVSSILSRVDISVKKHGSRLIAISGHYDCAGNPCDEIEQRKQIAKSVSFLKEKYPEAEITGLWINSKWEVCKI